MVEESGPEIQKLPAGLEAAFARVGRAAAPPRAITSLRLGSAASAWKTRGGSVFSHVGKQRGGRVTQWARVSSWQHCRPRWVGCVHSGDLTQTLIMGGATYGGTRSKLPLCTNSLQSTETLKRPPLILFL